jgi:hypothetical protein
VLALIEGAAGGGGLVRECRSVGVEVIWRQLSLLRRIMGLNYLKLEVFTVGKIYTLSSAL